ncbi:MAG: PD-(D/E)XK nuclease family protein [Candidatus Nanopelagicales bacterium]|nr:PD-(D/E)XK nuclease family protein [Candidatus Nanopelagicales bacterium]MDZ4250069.1 PD-(D/E)XK nuclease family protein [Candidatus Nanopelagicales bacterium]
MSSTTAATGRSLGPRPPSSLSPSRAGDFMSCPLLYRFRSIDRIPEPPGEDAVRGTLLHLVMERLFDLPAGGRTLAAAQSLIATSWESISRERPELPGLLFADESAWERWLADSSESEPAQERVARFLEDAGAILPHYFEIEDPNRLEPAERELSVSTTLDSGLVLRGIIDRLDRSSSGALRVVDYKTGRAPGQGWETKALFQMRFYGLVVWREFGQVPARLQLMYLASAESIAIEPTEPELLATQRKVEALWSAIDNAAKAGLWRPKPSRLCDWCHHKSLCPAWDGIAPPLPGSSGSEHTALGVTL